jgi:uncharacterized membrane protein
MQTKDFVKALSDHDVAEAIAQAEQRTSGEIRVFVSETEVDDPVIEAEKQFLRMGMSKTAQRNGVLIYFAPKSQKYAVVGDQGVHAKCGQKFWEHITEEMTPLLKSGKFTEAVVLAVHEIGDALAREFPPLPGDKNELPNRVERG